MVQFRRWADDDVKRGVQLHRWADVMGAGLTNVQFDRWADNDVKRGVQLVTLM